MRESTFSSVLFPAPLQPTTPTTSSVVAGIQVQEAVKMLHGLETLSGQGFVFDGRSHNSYVVTQDEQGLVIIGIVMVLEYSSGYLRKWVQ